MIAESSPLRRPRRTVRQGTHRLELLGDYSSTVGGGQAVMHDSAAKVNYGASSPRKDGAAVPEPPPSFEVKQK